MPEEIVYIGNGLCRVDIRSRARRRRFVDQPEFRVVGERVIFPETLMNAMKRALMDAPPKHHARATQAALDL